MTDFSIELTQQIQKVILSRPIMPYPEADTPSEQTLVNSLASTEEILKLLEDAGYHKGETIAKAADGESAQAFQDRAKQADESGNVPDAA